MARLDGRVDRLERTLPAGRCDGCRFKRVDDGRCVVVIYDEFTADGGIIPTELPPLPDCPNLVTIHVTYGDPPDESEVMR